MSSGTSSLRERLDPRVLVAAYTGGNKLLPLNPEGHTELLE